MQSSRPRRSFFGLRYIVFIIIVLVIIWCFLLLQLISSKFSRDEPQPHPPGISLISYHTNLAEYKQSVTGLTYHNTFPSDLEPDEIRWFKLGDLISTWSPDDTSPQKWITSVAHPNKDHRGGWSRNSIPRFDYMIAAQRDAAVLRRIAEVPFIVYNVPDLNRAAETAFSFTETGLLHNMGCANNELKSVERMPTNKYLYYSSQEPVFRFPNWTAPQVDVDMPFLDFVKLVEAAEHGPNVVEVNKPYHYLTIKAGEGLRTPWLRQALPMFDSVKSFFILDPDGFKGINCRFGMKGVVATAHYDGGRNFVAMIRGRKRYVLLPPEECPNLYLLPRGHPSARHSAVDWADIDKLREDEALYNANATEVVLSMGEVLYIPSHWFHYIISQDASIQCNARSGQSHKAREAIKKCGFY